MPAWRSRRGRSLSRPTRRSIPVAHTLDTPCTDRSPIAVERSWHDYRHARLFIGEPAAEARLADLYGALQRHPQDMGAWLAQSDASNMVLACIAAQLLPCNQPPLSATFLAVVQRAAAHVLAARVPLAWLCGDAVRVIVAWAAEAPVPVRCAVVAVLCAQVPLAELKAAVDWAALALRRPATDTVRTLMQDLPPDTWPDGVLGCADHVPLGDATAHAQMQFEAGVERLVLGTLGLWQVCELATRTAVTCAVHGVCDSAGCARVYTQPAGAALTSHRRFVMCARTPGCSAAGCSRRSARFPRPPQHTWSPPTARLHH